MKKIILTYLLLASLFYSCKKDTAANNRNSSKDEYFEDNLIYNDSNFLDRTKTLTIGDDDRYISNKQTQKIGDIYYTATMMPVDYYIKKNLNLFDKDSLAFYRKKLKGEKVIQFEFQHKDKKDLLKSDFTQTNYEEGVKYMAFGIKDDFYGVTLKGDTIKCKGVLFERNFKLAPFKRVLVYFKDKEDINSIKLIYKDNLYQNGIIKFNLIN